MSPPHFDPFRLQQHHMVRISCLVLTEKLWQVFMVKDTLSSVPASRYNKQTAFPYFLFKVYLTILTFWSSCFNTFV